MKFLVLLAVLAIAYLVWRNARVQEHKDEPAAPRAPAAAPQDMVCCPVCALHLPRPEAVAGPDGRLYCSVEHMRIAR